MGNEEGDAKASTGQLNLFTGEIESFTKGKDELNLAEFPIAVVAEAAPPGQLTLTFSDSIKDKSTGELVDRSVTVMGTEKWGLPAAQDDDVMIALLQLCYLSGWPKTIRFTRYQLCKMLRWSVGGASYLRIYKALHRLSTTNYNYSYAWRDRINQEWIPSQVFSYIQALKVHEVDRPTDSGLCEVTWSDEFHRSLKAGNLKSIDFDLLVTLKKPISKRAYRILDKRFGNGWTKVTYKLHVLAFEKIGISRSYSDAGQIKRLLLPAIRELEKVGYLKPLPPKERFTKVARGVWEAHFERASVKPSTPSTHQDTTPDPSSNLEQQLTNLGIFPSEAKKFVDTHPEEYLKTKIDEFPYRNPKENPGGLLADSIRRDLPPPNGYVSKEDRLKDEKRRLEAKNLARKRAREQSILQKEQDAADEKMREMAAKELESLTPEEREALEKAAKCRFPKAGPELVKNLVLRQLMDRLSE